MQNQVYYIHADLPIPLTLALHAAVLKANQRCSGKTLREHHVVIKDVVKRINGHVFDGVITFHDRVAERIFHEVCKENNLNVKEVLEYYTAPYIDTRVRLQHDGDGRLGIWAHYRDACIHLSGAAVNPEPITIQGEADGIVITDILIAGDHGSVNKTLRRYKRAFRYTQTTNLDWEYVVKKLHYSAALYLVTSKGLLIKVTSSGMRWQRPINRLTPVAKQEMRIAGYNYNTVITNRTLYEPSRYVKNNPFRDSMRDLVATESYELKR